MLLCLLPVGFGGCSGNGATSGQNTGTGGSGPGGIGTGGGGTGGVSGGGGTTASGGDKGTGGAGLGSGGTSTGGASTGGAQGAGGVQGVGGSGATGGIGGASGGAGARGQGGAAGGGGIRGVGTGGDSLGTGGAGAGGMAGAQADPLIAAAVLDGLALLKPCFSAPGSCAGCTCDENASNILNSGAAPENQHITKQLGGEVGVTYNVKLRVAGVSERYWYTGGTLDPTGKVFYTGGLPTIHSTQAPNKNLNAGQGACKIHPPQTDASSYDFPIPFAVPPEVAPADGCYNGFNVFAITVSSPKQTYFLNYTTDYDGVDRQPHAVYQTDYTVTIPIAGQATIDFYIIDGDHHQVANTTMTVPTLKNAQIKQPYSGNFLEFEVVDVTASR